MGGPQFSSAEFADFTKKWGVHLQLLTPIYTQSNGHAEAAVKSMKVFLSKSPKSDRIDSEKFLRGLLEWKNTLRANGLSTAEMVFGHNIRSILVYVVFHRSAHRSKTGPAWDGPYNSNSDTLLHMACPDNVNIIKYLVSCDLYPHNKI